MHEFNDQGSECFAHHTRSSIPQRIIIDISRDHVRKGSRSFGFGVQSDGDEIVRFR